MLTAAIGHSVDIDLDRAIGEVIDQAKAGLADAVASAGLLFIANDLDHPTVLASIRDAFPGVSLVGCTTAGEASPVLGFQDDSVLLVLFASPDVRFAAAIGRAPSVNPNGAAEALFERAAEQLGDAPPKLGFLFSDAMHGDPDFALKALTDLYDGQLPLVGGAAASYPPGRDTYLFFNDEVVADAMVALVLGGPLGVTTATETSWQPIGRAGHVTATNGKTIYRIDETAALDFYRSMLGPDAELFLGAPLAILEPDGGLRIRSPITFDAETRSVEVIGGVHEGDTVQLAFATVDDVHRGAEQVIERTLRDFPSQRPPALVFFCSCAARKMFLALDVSLEFEQLQKGAGAGVPVVGFYGYGEIGSESLRPCSKFHNQAIVSVAVG